MRSFRQPQAQQRGGAIMPRAAWTGTISLGLVNLPAQLVPISKGDSLKELLHDLKVMYESERERSSKTDAPGLRKIRNARYFLSANQDPKNQSLPYPQPHVISLLTSLDPSELSPVAIANQYVVVPSKGALHAFVLFIDALAKHHRTEVGVVEVRRQPRLCAMSIDDGALILTTLQHASELSKDKSFAKRNLNQSLRTLIEEFERSVNDHDLKHAG
jgi:non-homologous end joining protein Ku